MTWQWLIYNDCVFRVRNVYEFIMFHDRDEFVNFVGHAPHAVNLTQVFRQQFGDPHVASVTYWGGAYHVHCHMVEVCPCLAELQACIAAAAAAGLTSHLCNSHYRLMQVNEVGCDQPDSHPVQYQTYSGYNVWAADPRMPNFTACTRMTCHPKSVVRPLAVAVMSVHRVHRVREGWVEQSRLLDPQVVFTKHLRCMRDPVTGEFDATTGQLLCSEEEVLYGGQSGGVPVCPADVIAAVHRKHAHHTRG